MLISRLVGSQYVLMLQQEINTCFIIKQHCLPACQCAVEGERRRDGGDRNGRAESRCCPGDGGGGGGGKGEGARSAVFEKDATDAGRNWFTC